MAFCCFRWPYCIHIEQQYKAWDDNETKSAENRPDDSHSDIEILMISFCRINNVTSITVSFPEDRPRCERKNKKLIDL